MSVTISDVASRAGVSTSTVSKVINNNPTISAETTARVNAAIKELHYIPNSRAVSFAKGQAKNIVYLSTLEKILLMRILICSTLCVVFTMN